MISVFYALILLALIVPGATLLALYKFEGWGKLLGIVTEAYGDWMLWLLIAAVLTSQALLLFLSVDTSQKRPQAPLPYSRFRHRRRASHRPSSSAVIWSLGFAIRGEGFWKSLFDKEVNLLFFWGALWGLWGILFYLYFRNSSAVVTWLLKGSVLELLIVVPCHVIVRRRHDCSAPLATSFGIATGIAIMLLSFGPSVLSLYKKRLDSYPPRPFPSRGPV